jgi:hypothetical protein
MIIKGYEVNVAFSLTDAYGNIAENFPTVKDAKIWCRLRGRHMGEFNRIWTAYSPDDNSAIETGVTRNEAIKNYISRYLE